MVSSLRSRAGQGLEAEFAVDASGPVHIFDFAIGTFDVSSCISSLARTYF